MSQQAAILLLSAVAVSADTFPWNSRKNSKVFYINLDTSTSRRTHMEKELATFAGKVERIPAVSREQVHKYQSYVHQQGLSEDILMKDTEEVQGTIGCWLSHTLLLERLTKELHAEEHAVILEDDAIFPEDWAIQLKSTISTAPKDWDVLKVCGWGFQREEDAVDENWRLARGPFVFPSYQDPNAKFHYAGSCGYIVSGRSVARVVQHLHNQEVTDFDKALLSDASPNFPIRTYSMKKFLLMPIHGSSTIHTSRMLQAASTGPPDTVTTNKVTRGVTTKVTKGVTTVTATTTKTVAVVSFDIKGISLTDLDVSAHHILKSELANGLSKELGVPEDKITITLESGSIKVKAEVDTDDPIINKAVETKMAKGGAKATTKLIKESLTLKKAIEAAGGTLADLSATAPIVEVKTLTEASTTATDAPTTAKPKSTKQDTAAVGGASLAHMMPSLVFGVGLIVVVA